MPAKVSNAPLQRAFLESGADPAELCRTLGWTRERADTHRLRRTLGLMHSPGDYNGEVRETITQGTARAICEALGLSFEEVYPFDARLTCQAPGCDEEIITGEYCGWCREMLELAA